MGLRRIMPRLDRPRLLSGRESHVKLVKGQR